MKLFFVILLCLCAFPVLAQNNPPVEPPRSPNPLENISNDVEKLAKSVETLNRRMKTFFDTFSTNQGLQLTPKQQKLLLAFELLNRAEQRLATLQKLKIDLLDKQAFINAKLGDNEVNSSEESINRSVALTGTTRTEEIRENRRRTFGKERNDLTNLLNEIRTTLKDTESELNQTEQFVKSIRTKLFGDARQELIGL